MKEEDAISIITGKNAAILGIADRIGTIEEGKLASLVIWNNDPLHFSAFPKYIFAEGRLIRGE
jgi:imidazolonepropionase-like amidohydrolase